MSDFDSDLDSLEEWRSHMPNDDLDCCLQESYRTAETFTGKKMPIRSHFLGRRVSHPNTTSLEDDLQRNKMKRESKQQQLERGSQATIIQIAFRRYLCRKDKDSESTMSSDLESLEFESLESIPKPRRTFHKRICSEITMSDFDSDLDSLEEWRSHMPNDDLDCCLQESHRTAETFTGGESMEFHDSFTSLFSNDASSVDLPAQAPSRKLSPSKQHPSLPTTPTTTTEDNRNLCLPTLMQSGSRR
jgi:hypothetical protein